MRRFHLIALLAVYAIACEPALAQQPLKVKMTMDWIMQGPQAVFLRALDSGCFSREGLDVTIDRGYGSGDAVTKVASGAYDVGRSDLNVLMEFNANSKGPKAIAVFVEYDSSATSVITLKSSGIAKPQDLVGKRIASPTGDASRRLFPMFAEAVKIDPSTVSWSNIAPEIREPMLVRKEVDAITALTFSGIPSIEIIGVKRADIVAFRYNDYGTELFGHAIIANPKFAEANPKAVTSLLRCVVQAKFEALKDTGPAMAALKKRDSLADTAIEADRLKLSMQCCWLTDHVRSHGLGVIDEARLERSILRVAKTLNFVPPKLADIYTSKYRPPISELRLPPL